jgi:hypothetical protein
MDLGGQGGTSFPFDNHGDSVTGKILNMEEIQQTDLDTGKPAFWDDGKPKMQFRVTLQTELSDDVDDDGQRTIYLRGSRKPEAKSTLSAVLAAVKATTGATALDVGGVLTLTYVSDGVAKQRGYNAPKQYSATYRPPSTDLNGTTTATVEPLRGMLGAKPITHEQYAAMVAAGADPETLPGWVSLS